MINDQERLKKFIEILPEKTMDDLLNYYLFNARYPEKWAFSIFGNYKEHSKETLSAFSNEKTEKIRKEFNNSLFDLEDFLIKHFESKNTKNFTSPFLYLEPGLESTLSRPNSDWYKSKKELDLLSRKSFEKYKKFLTVANKESNQNSATLKDKDAQENIYLDRSGDLYRKPKNKYCYSMEQNSDRYKIIKYLIKNKGYQPTGQISSIFDSKTENSIISEIGKMNSSIKGKLQIKDNIILGKRGSGYRMNPKFKFLNKNQ